MHQDRFHPVVKTTVGAIIQKIEQGETKILLARRGFPPYQDHWCLPGGHIDQYETAQQAAAREVKEEVGLNLEARFLFYWDEILPALDLHAVVLVFTGNTTGTVHPQPGEVLEVRWFTRDEINTTPLAFQHNQILKKYFEEQG